MLKISNRTRNIMRYIVMFIALVVFGYSAYELTDIYLSYEVGKDTYKDIENSFIRPHVPDNSGAEPETDDNGIVLEGKGDGEKFYFDYDELLKMNKDAIGWMMNGEYISYPVVQGADNDYYLTHLVNRRYNAAGSLFMDYRSINIWESRNAIIYGHRMGNDTMFGSLRYYLKKSFWKSHPYFDIWCGKNHYRYYVFAAFQTNLADTNVYKLSFESDEEFLEYVNEHKALTSYDIDVGEITADDHILTLSTCVTNHDELRMIVQLVRRELVDDGQQ